MNTALPDRTDALDVLVIGAGQAGLALAWHLDRAGLRFLVLDAAPVLGHSWRSRWDTLRLFSPSQYDGLPGLPFPAPRDSYPTKDQVADYLAGYAARFELPVLLDAAVRRLEHDGGCFVAHTRQGVLRARQVVVATGAFRVPVVPGLDTGFDPSVRRLHSASYRRPGDLPAGRVLVVGAGNSGLQIALELAGTHDVTLAVGSSPARVPQRPLGRDLFWWLQRTRLMRLGAGSPLGRRLRDKGDLVIGTRHRDLRRAGVRFADRLVGADGTTARFADGTSAEVDGVVWATGLRPDHSFIDVPGALDEHGRARHREGASDVPGLWFLGLPWQRTRGSSLLGFVRHDAAWLVGRIVAAEQDRQSAGRVTVNR